MDTERRWVIERVNLLKAEAEKMINCIDMWLQNHDETSYDNFLKLFEDAQFVKEYVPHFEALHFAYILAKITNEEVTGGAQNRLIESVESLQQTEQRIKQVKFALWRLEWSNGEDRTEWLKTLLEDGVSLETLYWIIRLNAFDKKSVCLLLVEELLRMNAVGEAKRMLGLALQLFPEDADFMGLLKLL